MKSSKIIRRVLTAAVLCLSLGGCALIPSGLGSAKVTPASQKFDTVVDILKNKWYYGENDEDLDSRLIEQALAGMVSFDEDIHTMYMGKELATSYSDQLAGSNVGIGVRFSKAEGGNPLIREVFVNSPAEEGGILPGDELIAMDDTELAPLEQADIPTLFQEHADQPIKVRYLRDGQEYETEITPGSHDQTVSFEMGDDYGLIRLTAFSEQTGKDVVEALRRLEEAGIENLILDVQDNTGGYLHAVLSICSALLPNGSVVYKEKLRDNVEKDIKAPDSDFKADFDHIYILQNDRSASASEVLIGALRDHFGDRVTTIGINSYGKGTEQLSANFDDGTAIKYTIGEWLTPNGQSINLVGFAPDVEVQPEPFETIQYRDFEEAEAPIEADTVHPNAAAVQIFLQYLGYPADRSDEYYSAAGAEAMKQFESEHGLEADGKVSQEDLDALVRAVSEKSLERPNGGNAYLKALELIHGQNDAGDASEDVSPAQ